MTIRRFQNIKPTIASSAYIDQDAVVVGDVHIGEQSSVWPGAVIRGDVNRIRIGDRTNIQDGAVLHVASDNQFNPGGYPLLIGNGVTIGHRAVLHACTLGDYVLIGMGAIVLDDVVIPAKTMIAAGSVVPPGKKLESGYLYMGAPAKAVRPLTQKEYAWLSFSADHYVQLKEQHKS